MQNYKLFKDRLFIYICTLYLVGILFGIFIVKGSSNHLNFTEPNFVKIFCSNYWYIFLMWLFGFSVIGLVFNSFIIFFRAFLFGSLISILVPGELTRLGLLLVLEIVIFIPSFFVLSYFSLGFSWNSLGNLLTNNHRTSTKKYLNLILIETIIIIIYSVIIIMS